MLEAYFSYSRISTDEEKQKFNRQEKALEKYAKDNGISYFREFKDEASGASFDRPDFKVMDDHLQRGDTVVMKDLSRFTREAENGYVKYMEWLNKGVNIVFIDNPTLCSDYVRQMLTIANEQDTIPKLFSEFMIKIMLMTELDRVEKERLILKKRIVDGIHASDKKQGRKTGAVDKLSPELEADIMDYLVQNGKFKTQIEIIKAADARGQHISRNTLKKYISLAADNENELELS